MSFYLVQNLQRTMRNTRRNINEKLNKRAIPTSFLKRAIQYFPLPAISMRLFEDRAT